MLGLTGIIATIIAACKGHKTFAWIIGIWTAVAFLLIASGDAQYVLAPGWIFLVSALCMKNLKKVDSANEDDKDRVIFYCKNCGFIGSDYYYNSDSVKCPECNIALINSHVTLEQWRKLSDTEKQEYKESWGIGEKAGRPFICNECGEQFTGWYQKCPNCGAEGKMVKNYARDNVVSLSPPAAKEDTSVPESTTIEYKFICTSCGNKFTGWYQKCPSCNAVGKMKNLDTPVVETKSDYIKCPLCGKSFYKGLSACPSCGYEKKTVSYPAEKSAPVSADIPAAVSPAPAARSIAAVPEKVTKLTVDNSDLPPKLRRAFFFLEDGLFEKADKYIEDILDDDPENAYAYLGRLMIDLKLKSTKDLASHSSEVLQNNNYVRALRYGDEDLKKYLNSLKGV